MKQFNRRYIALAIPFVTGFLAIFVVPFAYSIYYSFVRSSFDPSFVGIDNYASTWSNQYFQLALANTGRFIFTAMPILVVLALALSFMLIEGGKRNGNSMGAFVLPMLLPSVGVILIFRMFFKARGGVLTPFFSNVGVDLSVMPALSVYAVYLWKNLGLNLILLIAAIQMIPKEQYEAAILDGASVYRKHVSITLPQILPTVFFVVVLSTVYALRIFKETYLLYGSYPDKSVYFMQHYINNHFFKLNYQKLTSGAMIFAAFIYVVLAIFFVAERRVAERV